jgi:hypothetical protein
MTLSNLLLHGPRPNVWPSNNNVKEVKLRSEHNGNQTIIKKICEKIKLKKLICITNLFTTKSRMGFYKRKNGHTINCSDALIRFRLVSTASNDALITYSHTKIASNHAGVCIRLIVMMQNNILEDFFTTSRESSYFFGMNEILLSKVPYNDYYSA